MASESHIMSGDRVKPTSIVLRTKCFKVKLASHLAIETYLVCLINLLFWMKHAKNAKRSACKVVNKNGGIGDNF